MEKLQKKSGTCLVLSGGATKAFYFHLGVLKVLGLQDVTSIVGSSAGAVMGGFLASGATLDALLTSIYEKQVYMPKFDTWVKTLTSTMLFKPRYRQITQQTLSTGFASLRFIASLPRLYNKDIIAEGIDSVLKSQSHASSFFDSVELEELFRNLLPSSSFADTEIDLYVTATALDSHQRAIFNGLYDFEDKEDYFMTDVPIHKAVRASAAVPGMFEPVKIKGRYFIDGEVKRTLSADVGIQLADRIIMSHTYQPLFSNGGGSVRDLGWVNILRQSATMILQERIERWREAFEQSDQQKEIIWVHPDPDDREFFTAPDFSFKREIQEQLIASGERAAQHALSRIH